MIYMCHLAIYFHFIKSNSEILMKKHASKEALSQLKKLFIKKNVEQSQ